MSDDRYLTIRELALYAGLCQKTIRNALVDPTNPLPHYRPTRKILVKRSEFDAWMEKHRETAPDISAVVREMTRGY